MIKLTDITCSRTISDDLRATGFDVYRASRDYSWIKFEPKIDFVVLAGEGSGGAFFAYGSGEVEVRPILHVTSYGEAGKIASHLDELLGILVALPFWQSILKFSGDGDLNEMRETAVNMQREYERKDANILEACDRLRTALPIPPLRDAVQTFHDAIHGTDRRLVTQNGYCYPSLFNRFKCSDNPNWR